MTPPLPPYPPMIRFLFRTDRAALSALLPPAPQPAVQYAGRRPPSLLASPLKNDHRTTAPSRLHAHPALVLLQRYRPFSLTSLAALALCLSATACGSLFNEGSAAGAGIAGAAVASKITNNAAVASGIGLGALAGAQAGVKYVEKNTHRDQQDDIAAVAGPLNVGQVAAWQSHHFIKLEPDQKGRVTVSRVISVSALDCKEIVFSVDAVIKKQPSSAFYVATICRDGQKWKWASAEPATERWGSLQ